jgi:hypothetical protein
VCRLGYKGWSVADAVGADAVGAVGAAAVVATGQAGLGGRVLRESERRMEERLPGCWRGGGEAAP